MVIVELIFLSNLVQKFGMYKDVWDISLLTVFCNYSWIVGPVEMFWITVVCEIEVLEMLHRKWRILRRHK